MIENIRRYSGLMIVLFAIVIVAFVLGDSSNFLKQGGGGSVLRIDGRSYSQSEFERGGSGGLQLASAFMNSGDFSLYPFLMGLTGGATSEQETAEKFFVGRMILRDAKEEFGIYPDTEEVSNYIRSLKAFSPQGTFDPEAYRTFIEKRIGRLGLTENDVRDLASDILVSKKLNAIIGSGLGVDRDAIAKSLALQNQKITVDIARLDIGPFEEKIQPTDDEIKAYWTNIQDAFPTEPKRKFTYIVATPTLPAEPAAEPEEKLPDDATPEAKEAAKKASEEKKAASAAKNAEERRKKQTELDTLVDDFLFNLGEQKGTGFEELAKANGWEVKTTELFARAASPKDLDVDLRASSRGGKAVDELFRIQETSDPFSKISAPIAIGENQWIVARLDGVEASRPQTYEEARDAARAQWISEKAIEAMKTAANEAVTKIKDLMATGKSFADAAKEAGITQVKSVPDIGSAYQPDGATEPRNLFEAAKNVDPGAFADVIVESDRAFIVHVAKREVVKEADAAKLDAEVTSRTTANETIAFLSWLAARTEAAKVEQLYKQ